MVLAAQRHWRGATALGMSPAVVGASALVQAGYLDRDAIAVTAVKGAQVNRHSLVTDDAELAFDVYRDSKKRGAV